MHDLGPDVDTLLRLVDRPDDGLVEAAGPGQDVPGHALGRAGRLRRTASDGRLRQHEHVVGDVEHPLAAGLEVAKRLRRREWAKQKPGPVGLDVRSHWGQVHGPSRVGGGDESFEDHAVPLPISIGTWPVARYTPFIPPSSVPGGFMIRLLGSPRRCCDGLTRRETLQAGALAALGGLSLPQMLAAETASQVRPAKAKYVILLYLLGGVATQDMYDLKPNAPAEVRGEFKPIS